VIDLIDANVLIEAHRRYYSMEVCPGFWEWMAEALATGDAILIPEIRDEVTPLSQDLKDWLRFDATVTHPEVQGSLSLSRQLVTGEANASGCTANSIQRFLRGGDYHLTAYAHAAKCRVVTLETREDRTKHKRKLKIPDLCDRISVAWATPFQMLKDHGAEFGLVK